MKSEGRQAGRHSQPKLQKAITGRETNKIASPSEVINTILFCSSCTHFGKYTVVYSVSYQISTFMSGSTFYLINIPIIDDTL